MTNLQAFEKLDLLLETADVFVEPIRDAIYDQWLVSIRPAGGGFPMVRGRSGELSEAVKKALELWETR